MTRDIRSDTARNEVDSPAETTDLVQGERTSVTSRYDLQIDEGIAQILARGVPLPLPDAPADFTCAARTTRSAGISVHLEPILARRRTRIGMILCGAAIGLILLWGGIASHLWSHTETGVPATATVFPKPKGETRQPATKLRLPVTVRVDPTGFPIELTGADPGRVLVAFCGTADGGLRYRPLGLSPVRPSTAGVTLGHIEDRSDTARRLAIRIYLDPRTSHWSAGDRRSRVALVDPGPGSTPRDFGPAGPPDVESIVEQSPPGAPS